MLLVGQIVLVVSRAAFWPATWAMASELPGNRGIQLGRLNAITNVGQIAGSALCGFLLAAAGFDATFATLAATGLLAFIAGLATRAGPAKALPHHRDLLSRYRPLLRRPIILYAVICAYLSALPFSLSMSFYPLLLASSATARRPRGSSSPCARSAPSPRAWSRRASCAPARHALAGDLRRGGRRCRRPTAGGQPRAADRLWMLVIGLGSGAMTLYFQITHRRASRPEERGSAPRAGRPGLERLSPDARRWS